MGRHLICLIDGTWVSADTSVLNQTYSNIYKLGMLLQNYSGTKNDPEDNIVFYSRGLGAQRRMLARYSAGGFAAGLEEEIADVYVNLASNFQPGDKIYLFGFSRGAVIAVAVAGLIGNVGLLHDKHINQYKFVWEAYLRGQQPTPSLRNKCYTEAETIEFLGVFDSVYGGSHNAEKRRQRLGKYHDRLPENIKHAVHILSLDDRRRFFRPILWSEGAGQQIEQIWVPGVHSDVGGTYQHDFLGDVSLLAMIDRIRAKTGLKFYEDILEDMHNEVVRRLGLANVIVSNEFQSWLWKVTGFRSTRVRKEKHVNQSVHPIVDELVHVTINYKGRQRNYPVHDSFGGVDRYAGFAFYPVPRPHPPA